MDLSFGDRHTVVTQEAIDGLIGKPMTFKIGENKYPGRIKAAKKSFAPNYVNVTIAYDAG